MEKTKKELKRETEKMGSIGPPSITKPKVEYYKSTNTTPVLMGVAQNVQNRVAQRPKVRPLDIGKTESGGLVQVICQHTKKPKIDFQIIPAEVVDLSVDWWDAELVGKINIELKNRSDPGKEGKTKAPLLETLLHGCPMDDDEYEWEIVEGSADFLEDSEWRHQFQEATENIDMGDLDDRLASLLKPGSRIKKTEGEFRVSGTDIIKTLWDILTKGQVTLDNGFDVTIYYEWLGEMKQKSKHIDTTVTVPVSG